MVGTAVVACMDDRTREESGKFDSEYEDSVFLDAVASQELPTTGDIAAVVGCDRRTAHARLCGLREDGKLESRKIGAAFVWSLPN